MASILFSAIGQSVGGPLGAAVGAAVGGTVDGALFGRGSAGPGDLLIQRSAYGEVLPRLYGVSRQAGVLIWALPLSRSGGEKGGGRPAYTSSFAIALSSRPILRIGRIWADGREIRNAAGDFETDTVFRVYTGGRADIADPMVVAEEGYAVAPGYGGLAYVVFEAFALAAFGNRIPNLSFEVVADGADSRVGDWVQDLARKASVFVDPTGGSDAAIGYSAGRDRWAGDLEALARAADISEHYAEGALAFKRNGRVFAVAAGDLCALLDVGQALAGRRTMALGDRPAEVNLEYFDPDRDYQAGRQSAVRARAGRILSSQAPLTTTAVRARALANRYLRKSEAAVETLDIGLSWRWLEISVGDSLTLDDRPEHWRVVRRDIEGMVVRLGCELCPSYAEDSVRSSSSGRALAAPVVVAGASDIAVFELPMAVGGKGGQGFWVSVAGGAGWRGADIGWMSRNGDWSLVGNSAVSVNRGVLLQPLGPATAQLWDTKSILEIVLDHEDSWLESRTADAVLSGANLLRVGEELVQFQAVEALGNRRFRLSALLRARFGSGLEGGAHAVGTRVEKLDLGRTLFQPFEGDRIGQRVHVRALGTGDRAGGNVVEHVFEGAGEVPLAPCHVSVFPTSGGDLEACWVGRDRRFFDWAGSVAQAERAYICRFTADVSGGTVVVEKRVRGLRFDYALAQQVVDFGGPLQQFSLVVRAEGDGPDSIRSSRAVVMTAGL